MRKTQCLCNMQRLRNANSNTLPEASTKVGQICLKLPETSNLPIVRRVSCFKLLVIDLNSELWRKGLIN